MTVPSLCLCCSRLGVSCSLALGDDEGEPEDAEAGLDLQARCTEAAGGVPPFVWQEGFARLFLGDPGSMTCLHVDLLPQLEFCHMLAGAKARVLMMCCSGRLLRSAAVVWCS